MTRKFLFGTLSLLALAPTALALQKSTIAGGDDDLEDLEIQRMTIERGLDKKGMVQRLIGGKAQVSLFANTNASRYSDDDWAKGQLVGRVVLDDPGNETPTGSGKFLVMARQRGGNVTFYTYSLDSKSVVGKSRGALHDGKPAGRDGVLLDLRTNIKIGLRIGKNLYWGEVQGKKKI